MRSPRLSLGTLSLAAAFSSALAATGGSFEDGGNTLISAMMMFLGNEESVYILDKAEGNAAQVLGHPAWGSLWDIQTRKAVVMDVKTNVFCASGMHLPNGSYVTFGGNDGVGRDGKVGSQLNPDGTGAWDSVYQDFDGRRAIRIVNPCRATDNLNAGNCMWYDEPTQLSMKRNRWYSAAEATGEGRVVIVGGFVSGGFVNRWVPNVDPARSNGLAEPTYEYFPPKEGPPQVFDFMIRTSGLNAYAHTFLMPSGRMMVQANLSTILWDHEANREFPLPNMPKGVVRVYPASGAVAMLPLTPANNYTPTMLFCGGSDMPEQYYGDYGGPYFDIWEVPASRDCQRLTPEPQDGSTPAYEQDDDLIDPRTMGQFVILPDGKLLVVNGGRKGAAGYSLGTRTTPNLADMPFGPSLATEPVMTPAIYDPNAPRGSRWSNEGLNASHIPRLYHSTAILLPDGSVFLAGSNPNPDVDLAAFYPTEYRADIFYPPYFAASVRPAPAGVPKTLSYGGDPFDITIPASSYTGVANDAAEKASVFIHRSGFTTHAMNMGQRSLQLNTTYTVAKNGTITLHVSQVPPNPNLFQPGPVLLFVNIDGIPSNGTYVIVGNGLIGPQPVQPASVLPASVQLDLTSSGSDGANTTDSNPESEKKSNLGLIVGLAVGAVALLAIVGAIVGICLARRKRAAARSAPPKSSAFPLAPPVQPMNMAPSWAAKTPASDSAVFAPLHKSDEAWDSSTANLNAPYGTPYAGGYKDDVSSMNTRGSEDPYDPHHPAPLPGITQVHGDTEQIPPRGYHEPQYPQYR